MGKHIFIRYFKWSLVALCFVTTACKSTDDETEAVEVPVEEVEACFESTDVLVSNSGSDAVIAFDAAGNYKRIVYSVSSTAGESIYGMEILATGELAVVVDGTDRVMAVSPEDCSARILIADANFTGTVRGIAQLSSGDILVVETSNVERFSSTGTRITTGAWPKALQTTATELSAISTGGFVHCSTGTDVVRTYNDAGTQVATRSSGIAATTDAMGCKALASGNIVTAWSGTTDSVVIYNSTLATALFTYTDVALLGAPGGIAERANGNILVVDRTFHHVVEITNQGVYVGTFGAGLLNIPEHVLVVP